MRLTKSGQETIEKHALFTKSGQQSFAQKHNVTQNFLEKSTASEDPQHLRICTQIPQHTTKTKPGAGLPLLNPSIYIRRQTDDRFGCDEGLRKERQHGHQHWDLRAVSSTTPSSKSEVAVVDAVLHGVDEMIIAFNLEGEVIFDVSAQLKET